MNLPRVTALHVLSMAVAVFALTARPALAEGNAMNTSTLTAKQKSIVPISALASLGGVNSQLRSHFNAGLNVGLTGAQLQALVGALEDKVGKKEAANAAGVLREVLANR